MLGVNISECATFFGGREYDSGGSKHKGADPIHTTPTLFLGSFIAL